MASIFDRFSDRSAVMVFKDKENVETSFAIDVTTSIDTSLSASVTNFPVEGRGNITDHIQPAPLALNLQCLISESPSDQFLTLAASVAGAGIRKLTSDKISRTFAGAAGAAAVAFDSSELGKPTPAGKPFNEVDFAPLLTNRGANSTRKGLDIDFPKRAMLGLIKMFQAGTIFSLHTFFTSDIYTDMVMTSLSFSQTPKEGDSLSFRISCKQIVVTTAFTQSASLELKASDPASSSLTEVVDKGKKPKVPVVVPENRSFFKKLLNPKEVPAPE